MDSGFFCRASMDGYSSQKHFPGHYQCSNRPYPTLEQSKSRFTKQFLIKASTVKPLTGVPSIIGDISGLSHLPRQKSGLSTTDTPTPPPAYWDNFPVAFQTPMELQSSIFGPAGPPTIEDFLALF